MSGGSAAEIIDWLLRVAAARRDRSLLEGRPSSSDLTTFDLPEPEGTAMQVVGIPLAKPGVYVVELASRALGAALLGADRPMFVQAAALVTDLAVHLEWGREGSLVWVTTLEKGEPVAGAAIAVHDCGGKVLWQGKSDASGLARILDLPREPDLPICREPASENDEWDPFRDFVGARSLSGLTSGLFVTARRGDDLGFVHSSWNDGIESFRWNLPSAPWQGPFVAHTVLARALLRAGDTAYMKHFFRAQTDAGFALASAAERPTRLVVRHLGSGTEYALPLAWQSDGTAETTWPVPREAKLGRYEVALVRPGRDDPAAASATAATSPGAPTPTPTRTPRPTPTPPPPYAILDRGDEGTREWIAGEFRVEEFRVPLLRTVVQLPAGPLVAPAEVPVDVTVQYLAGGGASGLPVTLRSRVMPATIDPPAAIEGFTVGNGAAAVGIVRQEQGAALPEAGAGGEAGASDAQPAAEGSPPSDVAATRGQRGALAGREQIRLDASGGARSILRGIAAPREAEKLLVEAELRDPNGETQTASASVALWPAALLPAIQAELRRDGKRRISAAVGVLDPEQKLVAGVPVVIEVLKRTTYTTRQRVVGGFYAYQDVEEVRRVKTLCRGRTGADGIFRCRRRAPGEGDLIVQARLADANGRPAAAHTEVWVPGHSDAWFEMSDSDRMDLIAERRRYEPGETAHLQVRMPFRRARALVTVGREGVMDARVVELSGKDPAIEVPIEDAFSPNVFVQVLAVRGRASGPPPTALVDLGKPSFRVGIAELDVGWKPHRIAVRVEPERTVYKVRETARVAIAAEPAAGGSLPRDANVAIAAVDEGLLELLPNPSVDLLRAMMGRRAYLVETATAQLQVVGKRHFGKKALPAGGGGGRQATRELFDTLLLWKGRVPLDAQGRATIDVPLNDSLTSFRIVAVAAAGAGHFGTGEATIRATQDLMVLSGLAPVVRTGDRYRAEFTVRNATDRPQQVALTARTSGVVALELAPEGLELGAGEARVVGWPIEAPAESGELVFEVAAQADGAGDRLSVKQRVVPAVPVRTLQATLVQWTGPGSIVDPVAAPAGALAGQGGIDVALAPSLVAGLAGVRDWMARYPYGCLEQRVSRAIALGDAAAWDEVAGRLAASQDGDGLLKFFPSMERGDASLTAYVLAVSRAAGLALPAPVEKRVLEGLKAFVDGTLPRRSGEVDPSLPLRKLEAAAALAAAGAAGPDLLAGMTIEPALWPTSTALDWWSLLLHWRDAPSRAARLAEVEQVLRARLDLSGTTLAFSGDRAADARGPFGGGDVDAVRLVALALEARAFTEDQARLARGALARQQRGAWPTTVANAWGTIAIRRFAAAHEAGPVTGATTAELAGAKRSLDWKSSPAGGSLTFAWPDRPSTITVEHQGAGKPWATIAARAAVPLTEPIASGFRIRRSVAALEQRSPGRWSVGDSLRVRLEIEASADLGWVVIDDPVPPGASHLARGLATDSQLAPGASPTPAGGGPEPTFVERSFESHRAYFERVSAGRLAVEYAIKLNQAGTFHLPPTHAEALYAPEVFGESPNAPIEVAP